MNRLLYLAVLSMLALLVLAPAAVAQDVDCPQLSFEEAQSILASDPSDPNRLDADNDGVACEQSAPAQPKEEAEEAKAAEKIAEEEKEEAKKAPPEAKKEEEKEAKAAEKEAKEEKKEAEEAKKKDLPKTGGPGSASLLALGAGALLVGGGLVVRRLIR